MPNRLPEINGDVVNVARDRGAEAADQAIPDADLVLPSPVCATGGAMPSSMTEGGWEAFGEHHAVLTARTTATPIWAVNRKR